MPVPGPRHAVILMPMTQVQAERSSKVLAWVAKKAKGGPPLGLTTRLQVPNLCFLRLDLFSVLRQSQ